MFDRTMQRAFRDGRMVSQTVGSYLLQSSMKTSTGRLHPVRLSMRSDTSKIGMYFAFAVVTIPVVSLLNGNFGARRCAEVRMV